MKKIISVLVMTIFLAALNRAEAQYEALEKYIEDIVKKELVVFAKNPIIINAVRGANGGPEKTRDEIAALEKRWIEAGDMDAWIGSFLTNPCAAYLKDIQEKSVIGDRPLYAEIFVMDDQGFIVAETSKTTDYWQGDEDKFIKAFDGGKGALFIGEPMFDESTIKYSVQVSVPVFDPRTKRAIGAITFGIDLDAMAGRISS